MKITRQSIFLIVLLVILIIFAGFYLRGLMIQKEFVKISGNLEAYIENFDIGYRERKIDIHNNTEFLKEYYLLLDKAQYKTPYIKGGGYDYFVFNIILKNSKILYLTVRIAQNNTDMFVNINYKSRLVFKHSIDNDPEAVNHFRNKFDL